MVVLKGPNHSFTIGDLPPVSGEEFSEAYAQMSEQVWMELTMISMSDQATSTFEDSTAEKRIVIKEVGQAVE